jgi:hypothetical protein
MTNKTDTDGLAKSPVLESEKVDNIDNKVMYTAKLEFRSIGGAPQVHPYFSYSHQFPDDYQGEWPSAYLAMRDLAFDLAVLAQQVFNTEVPDAEMPSDPDERAKIVLGIAATQKEAASSKKH